MHRKLIQIDNKWYFIVYMFESEELARSHSEEPHDVIHHDTEDSGCWCLLSPMNETFNTALNNLELNQ